MACSCHILYYYSPFVLYASGHSCPRAQQMYSKRTWHKAPSVCFSVRHTRAHMHMGTLLMSGPFSLAVQLDSKLITPSEPGLCTPEPFNRSCLPKEVWLLVLFTQVEGSSSRSVLNTTTFGCTLSKYRQVHSLNCVNG